MATITKLTLAVAALAASTAAFAQYQRPAQSSSEIRTSDTRPAALRDVGWDSRLGESISLDLPVVDADGRPAHLGDAFGQRPVLLALVYYRCPMLCSMVLKGVVSGLRPLDLLPGRDFELVVVSFDPRDTPAEAAKARTTYLADYGRPDTASGWHFYTAAEPAIAALAKAVGFRFAWDAERGEFAHAGGITILTPQGRISRYLWGIDYAPKDLRLALVESSDGKIGTFADRVLLYCFHYDPAAGTYSAMTMNLIRAGGAMTVLALGVFVAFARRKGAG